MGWAGVDPWGLDRERERERDALSRVHRPTDRPVGEGGGGGGAQNNAHKM